MLFKEKLVTSALVAEIDDENCVGCQGCLGVCPYGAIQYVLESGVCRVNTILCKGCGSCVWTERLVREVVEESSADVDVEKVTKTSEMVPYGVMSTPAIVIDERVVHAGGIPTKEEVQRWVTALQA